MKMDLLSTTKIDPGDLEFLINANQFQGGLTMLNRLYKSLGANYIRGLMLIEEKKLWRPLGFKSFVDYLNSDHVPFGSTKFYQLRELLLAEGDEPFDLLTGHRIPASTRLALVENGVEIELDGNEIVIQGNRAPVGDKAAIFEIINAIKNSFVLRDHRENTSKKETEKLKKDIKERDRIIESMKNDNSVMLLNDPYIEALLQLTEAFKHLIRETEKLSTDGKQKWQDPTFEVFANNRNRLSEAFRNEPNDPLPQVVTEAADHTVESLKGETFNEALGNFLDNVDLDANDDDLISQL